MVILRCRVLIVGDATVGKTSMVQTFINGPSGFPKNYAMTPGCEIFQKQVKLENSDKVVEFQIIDTGGQSIFKDIALDMFPRSNAVIFVYDVTSQESFRSLQYWIRAARDTLKESYFTGIIVANKTDLNDRIRVEMQEGASFANQNRFEFIEVSALKTQDVEVPFNRLAAIFARNYEDRVQEVLRFS
ncbi:IFT27 [Blepharisma stoltei]|uniref:Uncharacterized protein n=1 Tax=Blepharisma stoltei TaxID=1481888 RepID=A0AAU9IZA4_9CILI|nr:unnamed protein product [Blepharisma stoltei]